MVLSAANQSKSTRRGNLVSFRGASCNFVDRVPGRQQNDPRNHTNRHEQEKRFCCTSRVNLPVRNGIWKMENEPASHFRMFLSPISLLLTSLVFAQPLISQTPSPAKAAKTVTGHYRLRNPGTPNSLEVLQLPAGKIQFHLIALWVSPNNRENVHNGELEGIIELKSNTATYETETCKVTIRFFSKTAVVTQDSTIGDCDFGVNVTASGIYRKLNSRKPTFGSQGLISKDDSH